MAEQSYPVEELPLTGDQWRSVTRGIGDGVLDEGGGPYGITLDNAQNTATISVDTGTPGKYAHAILRGFYHRLTSAQALSVPAVTAATKYTIALQFDPTRKAMPVQLGVFKGALDRVGGKAYLILHTIERKANQLLTDATLTTYRPRTAPSITVYKTSELPPAAEALFGTIATVWGENTIKMAGKSDWVTVSTSSGYSLVTTSSTWSWRQEFVTTPLDGGKTKIEVSVDMVRTGGPYSMTTTFGPNGSLALPVQSGDSNRFTYDPAMIPGQWGVVAVNTNTGEVSTRATAGTAEIATGTRVQFRTWWVA